MLYVMYVSNLISCDVHRPPNEFTFQTYKPVSMFFFLQTVEWFCFAEAPDGSRPAESLSVHRPAG